MSKKTNVLMIYADQMHRFAMGCMDNPDVDTPNLDCIASEGALFRHAYSSTPVCSPFRVNLVTGRYGMETGARDNCCAVPERCHSLVDDFNEQGYRTSFVGKWHVGGNGNNPISPEHRADFQDFIGYQCYNGFYTDVCFYDEDGTETRYEEHRTDVTTNIAIERLQGLADEPFFMLVGFQAPHYPEQPSPEFDHMYRGRDVTPRPNYSGTCPYIPTYSPRSPRPYELCADYRRYGNDIHEYLRMYYGMVSQIDANVGRILDELERLGIADSTLVVFTSDHGDLAGSHGLNGKCTSHEESAGIPLIMRGPGVTPGSVIDVPIDSSSFLPTCMAMAGVSASTEVAERGRTALLEGKHDRQGAYADLKDWAMLRLDDFKLTITHENGEPTHLFNITEDPYEQNNLVACGEHQSVREEMRTQLVSWRDDCLAYRKTLGL